MAPSHYHLFQFLQNFFHSVNSPLIKRDVKIPCRHDFSLRKHRSSTVIARGATGKMAEGQ